MIIVPVWKDIPTLSGYQASSEGQIKGPRGLLSLFPRESGYLYCQAGGYQWRVNRLVCMAFHGLPPAPFYQAAHENNIRNDNSANNVYWATPGRNGVDLALAGSLKGEKHPRAKLSAEDVNAIRLRKSNGESVSKIARDYPHCSRSTVSHAAHGRNWAHV